MKKMISKLLVCVFIITMLPNDSVLAETKAEKAKTDYSTWLTEQSSSAYFTLADLNADKVPELLYTENYSKKDTFNCGEGSIFVYSDIDGVVTQLGELSTVSTYNIYFNKKTKKYVSKYTYGDTFIGYETLNIASNQIQQNNIYTLMFQVAQCDYSKDGKATTQQKYYDYVNANYNIFDGTKFNSKKFQKVKSYKNSIENREALLK